MKIKSKQIVQGGFSEPILQPIYVVTIGTILFLNPVIGLFWATLIVALPSFLIAYRLSKNKESFSIPASSIMHIVTLKTNNKYSPNYYDLYDFMKNNTEVSVTMIKIYFGVSRYKAKVIRDALIDSGYAIQKQSSKVSKKSINNYHIQFQTAK